MFYAREDDIIAFRKNIERKDRSVTLVYGRRYCGKTSLIQSATEHFKGLTIEYLCANSTLEGNIKLFTQVIREALGLTGLYFYGLSEIFEYLGRFDRKVLVILDEYQFLRDSAKKGEVDLELSDIIDNMSDNLRLVICGSDIISMKELLLNKNPLYGKFTLLLHLSEFDYIDSVRILHNHKDLSTDEKLGIYSVFGGSPYVLEVIERELDHISSGDIFKSLVTDILLPDTSPIRLYIENILLREIRVSYDVRILSCLRSEGKRYSDIVKDLGYREEGSLDKQLKSLLSMELIEKKTPVNHEGDRKKQYYEINDNLLKFYFTYIFGNETLIRKFGADFYYDTVIKKNLDSYLQDCLNIIALQYVERRIRKGAIRRVENIGAYRYEAKGLPAGGYFYCSIKLDTGYDIYIPLYRKEPLKKNECDLEVDRIQVIPGIRVRRMNFISTSGFDFETDMYGMITGEDLYAVSG